VDVGASSERSAVGASSRTSFGRNHLDTGHRLRDNLADAGWQFKAVWMSERHCGGCGRYQPSLNGARVETSITSEDNVEILSPTARTCLNRPSPPHLPAMFSGCIQVCTAYVPIFQPMSLPTSVENRQWKPAQIRASDTSSLKP
jgi:hypothetical protein